MTATKPCLVLYGNSVFLAGIKAELECDPDLMLELLTVEAGCTAVPHLLRERKPCAVLFDLGIDQPSFLIPMLREQPDLLLIGVDPSRDEALVLSVMPHQALSVADLLHVIQHKDFNMESMKRVTNVDFRRTSPGKEND